MPECAQPKLVPHPYSKSPDQRSSVVYTPDPTYAYAELVVTSNYTFLTGASHPEELATQAATLGYRAMGMADLHSVAGVVRAHVQAKELGIPFVLGARLRLIDLDAWDVCVYPTDLAAYGRLCRLLTTGKRRTTKGSCELFLSDLQQHARGLLAIAIPRECDGEDRDGRRAAMESQLRGLRTFFDDDRLSLAACVRYAQNDAGRLHDLSAMSQRSGVPLVATNDAMYHHPDRRALHDVVTCIRHSCTLSEAGYRLAQNAERYLKTPEEMHRLMHAHLGAAGGSALARTLEIVRRCAGFNLDQLRYDYPDEVVPEGYTPQRYLAELVERGADRIYKGRVPAKVRAQIDHELGLIEELRYAPYFLTVYDLVRFARTGEEVEGTGAAAGWPGPILCQGRGAAANSAVCFCLGVTSVDPTRIDLLFERFVSRERNEPPDIDIDFEHQRREEVIQYIYRRYGRERASLTAEVISYRRRSAIRDVGKALGLSLDLVDRLAKSVEWFDGGIVEASRLRELGVNPEDPTIRWLIKLVTEILGFPRHLSQHVGGFVITRSPLCELVPVENAAMPDRTVIEWDKDDIDAMGMLKVDVLGLGMLTALRKCMALVDCTRMERWRKSADHATACFDGVAAGAPEPLTLANIPAEDPETYAMIQKADTVGVFQIESRAQMSMLPRLKPRDFYDLVIEVAIVRPGPIQGGMVHPYLKRRNGEETIVYVHPAIEEVLKKTLGVPLFQEQCMALAVKAAGFTPGEADQLRRAMAAWKRKGGLIYRFGKQLIEGMRRNGIPQEFAERCFEQIKGFSEYGFPESHAASFALLVYASCWLKRHYPAEFCAALLNSQPMGFYAPAQLVRDAREHGVEVRPVDVLHSHWDTTMEGQAIRLGMNQVKGMRRPEAQRIADTRSRVQAGSVLALWRASGVSAATMRRLAGADAFGSMGLSRQQALWQTRLLRDDPMPLFDQHEAVMRENAETDGLNRLPQIEPIEQVVQDYGAIGLSLKAHPLSFARAKLQSLKVRVCADLRDERKTPDGAIVSVAGLVLVRQRPGTANDVTFMTLEDESGIANLVIWYRVYQRYRRQARSRVLIATGRIQRQGDVVHVMVTRLRSGDDLVRDLRFGSRDFH